MNHFAIKFSSINAAELRDYYKILGIDRKATDHDIKQAFLKQSKLLHPDVNKEDPNNHSNFVQLNEAYQTLSNTNSRKIYDMEKSRNIYHQYNTNRNYTNNSSYQYNTEKQAWERDLKYADEIYKKYGMNSPKSQSTMQRKNMKSIYFCIVLSFIGSYLLYVRLTYFRSKYNAHIFDMNQAGTSLLNENRRNAKEHGNDGQLKILLEKMRAE